MTPRRNSSHPAPRRHRRLGLLAALLAAATAVTVLVSAAAWPAFVLAIIAAFPLARRPGLVLAAVWTAAVFVVIAGSAATVAELATGWSASVVGAALVGARYGQVQKDLSRVVDNSFKDRLTGLYNFAFFSDALRREVDRSSRYGTKLTLVLFDLDEFKSFNDVHGHEAGNRLLEQVGAVFEEYRRSADIAARFGGEEFALLVPGGVTAGYEAAERIRIQVSRLIVLVGNGQHDGRTISAGVAGYRPGESAEALVECADRALYLSKRRGRNRVSVSGETPLPLAAQA